MKIDHKISEAMKNYKDFEVQFNKNLKEQITKIKENQIEDYAFDNDAFLLKLTEAFFINKGSYLSKDKLSQIKIKEANLTKDLDAEKKKIESLNMEMKLQNDQYSDKIKELNEKFEKKAKEVEEKEKEIQNLSVKIKKREMEIKDKDKELNNYNSVLERLKTSQEWGGEEIERIKKEERERIEKEERESIEKEERERIEKEERESREREEREKREIEERESREKEVRERIEKEDRESREREEREKREIEEREKREREEREIRENERMEKEERESKEREETEIREIEERQTRERQMRERQGKNDLEFNSKPLDQKILDVKANWKFVANHPSTKEWLRSLDGKYLVSCKFKLGILKAGNLNGRL